MKYLDTNIFIYILDKNAKKEFSEKSEAILRKIEEGETAIVSVVTLMEVLWWCERYLKHKIKQVYDMVLSFETLKIINVNSGVISDALFFKEKYLLELNDCISISVMNTSKINDIYSNDSGFDKVEWIKRIF